MNPTLPVSGVGSARIAFARTVFARIVQLCLAVVICAPGVAAQSIDAFPSLFAVEGEVTTEDAQETAPGEAARGASPREATFVIGALDEVVNAGVELSVSSDAAGRGQGLKLTRDQKEALRRVLGYAQGHDVHPRGRGLGRHRHKVIRFPDSVDDLYGFALAYGPETGLTSVARRGRGGWLLAVRDTLEALDDVTYSWSGTLYAEGNPEGRIGTILLVYSTESGFSGTIRVRADTWTVAPIGGDLYVLVNADETKLETIALSPSMSGGASQARSLEFPLVEQANGPTHDFGTALRDETALREAERLATAAQGLPAQATTTVLALWTSAAAASGIDVNTRIFESISQANAIYAASALPDTRVVLAHKELLPGFTETPVSGNSDLRRIVGADIQRFRSDATVLSLRDQYSADVVVLFVKPEAYRRPGTTEIIRGVANRVANLSAFDPNDAFAIVDLSYATSTETFTHEVGHLQGAQHHPDDETDPTRGAPYGRGHRDEWDNCWWVFSWACGNHKFATTMANNANGFGRVGHISNPNVIYQGRPTGIANSRDNARVIEFSDFNIAQYRLTPIPVMVTQSGGSGGTYTFTASASGGSSGTLFYEWSVSLGQPGSYVYASNATTFTVQVPSGTSYVRLRVGGGPGETVYVYRTVTYTPLPMPPAICQIKPFLPECQGFDPFLQRGTVADLAAETTALIADLNVWPNPISSSGRLGYTVEEAGRVRISVYDTQGREVAVVVDSEASAGAHSATLDTAGLAPGIYSLRMVTGAAVVHRRMTVIR